MKRHHLSALRNSTWVYGVHGEVVRHAGIQAADLSRSSVVNLIAREESIGSNAIADDVKLRSRSSFPTHFGDAAISWFLAAARNCNARNLCRWHAIGYAEYTQSAQRKLCSVRHFLVCDSDVA